MATNVEDMKALNRSHGVGYMQAKLLLDRAGGDLAQAERLAEAAARNEALKAQGGGPEDWAAREAEIRRQIREAPKLHALRALWNKDLLTPLLSLPSGPAMDTLVAGIIQQLKDSAPDFERPAPKPWHLWFLRGVPDVRLGLFHTLALSERRQLLADSLGLLGQTGSQLRALSLNLFPSSAELLSRMPLPSLRELHLNAPFGDLSTLKDAPWLPQLRTLGISVLGNSGKGQHPDALDPLSGRKLAAVLKRAPKLEKLSLRGLDVGELDLMQTQLKELRFSSCIVQEPDFPDSLEHLSFWRCVLGHFVFPAATRAQPERVELTLCGELKDGKLRTDPKCTDPIVYIDGVPVLPLTLELGKLEPIVQVLKPPAWAR